MRVSDVPTLELVGVAVDKPSLIIALTLAVKEPNKPFLYFERLPPLPTTRIVVSQHRIQGIEIRLLPKPYTLFELANLILLQNVRHVPSKPIQKGSVKGWEIQTGQVDGNILIVVDTAWIRPKIA